MDRYGAARAMKVMSFTRWLERMYVRAHKEVRGNCCLILAEDPDSDTGEDQSLNVSLEVPAELVVAVGDGSTGLRDDWPAEAEPSVADRSGNRGRFIQFCFEQHWFCSDLPNSTLWPNEATRILRDRSGFFWVRDMPRFQLNEEEFEPHDPLRKVYLYGDERSAAEDIAYIYFDLWHFPVDSPIYITAFAFGDGPSFEHGHLME